MGNLIPIRCNGNQIDEASSAWKTTGTRNYTKEFREAVAAEANDPNRSIAEVARAHGLNANMVAQWRRSLLEAQRATSTPSVALLPVDVIDLPSKDVPNHSLPQTLDVSASSATSPGCEIEIEVGKRRIVSAL
ncbi:transposase [Burkholderia glumae]|uniref:transposase n=1 Tax=Burkholderia glumae TaxID=337 RepID=UPI0009B724BA